MMTKRSKPAEEALGLMSEMVARLDSTKKRETRVLYLIAIAHLTTALILLDVAQSSRRGVRDAQALVKKTVHIARLVSKGSTCP